MLRRVGMVRLFGRRSDMSLFRGRKLLLSGLFEHRKAAGLRQIDLAEQMGVYQSWVTHMESGQRRIDVVELIELGKILGFDPVDVVRKLSRK